MKATHWDLRYEQEAYVFGTEPNDFVREMEPELPRGARILSLAEGEGRNGVFLAAQGHEVTAVDLSAVGRRKALALAGQRGVSLTYHHADVMEHDPGQACWDAVVIVFLHMPPAERALLLERVCHALRPGGLCICEAYHPEQIQHGTGGPKAPELFWDPDDIRHELRLLRELRLTHKTRHITEGHGHVGPSAVLQVVGRK